VRAAGLCVALAVLCAAAAATAAPPQRVTFIGDSVATEILDHREAADAVAKGVHMDFQLAPCRRLDGVSCPYEGKAPETVLQLIAELGPKLAPTVIVAVGYNDYEDQYAAELVRVLGALEQHGVKRVLWLTLRGIRQSYLPMNDAILAAAANHPELTVVDWSGASLAHDEWFQSDGLHLLGPGADALAALIHRALVRLGVAPTPKVATGPKTVALVRVVTRTLPAARVGVWYTARLGAAAGVRPYTWALATPPAGLHVRPNGTLFGKPTRPGTFRLHVVVADAAGTRASAVVTLRVGR
jgi:hypothetical protein